jgi:nanoRNase/pAp phosphatase (c-di-AMP/oligoRNAs hydrolase)
MENSFGSIIESAKSVLVVLPTKPYFDQVAAGLALYLSLRDKKETAIMCPSPMVVEFNRLVAVNKIVPEVGNKYLNIKFVNYKAEDIEKVSCNVEEGEIVLSVVPKSGFEAPKKEQVEILYSGVSADTVILVGGATQSHFPIIPSPDLVSAKIVHVGIRALETDGSRGILSFARPASTTSELVASLIVESGLELDPDIATNLLAGVEDGSKGFKGFDVTAETFQIVANLLRAGGKRQLQEKLDSESFPPGSIPGEVLPQSVKIEEVEKKETPPQDWLEPKIYKGTTVS